jgi:hypothetical protein
MQFPFDEWGCPGADPADTSCCFSDVTLVYSSVLGTPGRTIPWWTRPSLDASSGQQQAVEVSLCLHRIVLSQSCPSFFGQLLRAPICSRMKSTQTSRDIRWVREDRLAPEIASVGIPVVLRYIYSGVLGVLSGGDSGEIAPLGIDDVVAVLIVATAWCCDAVTSEQQPERLLPLVSYLYEHILSLCDAANDLGHPSHHGEMDDHVDCTRDSVDAVPQSQLPMTLPSPRFYSNPASAPAWSKEELIKNFISIITTVDALATAQELFTEKCRAHQGARHHHREASDVCHVVRTSDAHRVVQVLPSNTECDMTLTSAATMQEDARSALAGVKRAGVDPAEAATAAGVLSTMQQIFGSIWCRARESLVAITIDSLGSELLITMLPEIAKYGTTSSSSWGACVLNICRDCETRIADPLTRATEPAASAVSQHELVKFFTAPSTVAASLDLVVDSIDSETFFCGASLRCVCWLLWRWSQIISGAVSEAIAARRDLLGAVCEAFSEGLPPEESMCLILAQALGGDPESSPSELLFVDDNSTRALVNLGRACRMHDILRLQQASLSRLAAAVISKLCSPSSNEQPAVCQSDHQLRLASVLPSRFSSSSEPLPPSLWHALSFVVRTSPGHLMVRCHPGDGVDLVAVSALDVSSVSPMVLWTVAVGFRDEKLVRWMLQEYFSNLSDVGLANATQNAPQAPSLWAALSLASTSMVTGKTPLKGTSRKRRRSSPPANASGGPDTGDILIDPPAYSPVLQQHADHDDRQESLPLFSTLAGREILTALSPVAAHFTNPNSLFPITMGGDGSPAEVPAKKASSWDDVLAQDSYQLTSWMASVQELCDKLFRSAPPDQPRPPPATDTASTGDSVVTDDDGSTTQRPSLLSVDDEVRVRQSTLALRKQLDESRRVRETHAEHIRLALHALLADELRDAQQALSALTTETLKPAMEEVRALESSRASAQHEMGVLQSHITDLSSKLESVQQQCTSQLDTARSQLTQYRGLVERQEARASRLMDSLDTHIIPALEAKRSAVLTKMLETVSSAVSTLQERGA